MYLTLCHIIIHSQWCLAAHSKLTGILFRIFYSQSSCTFLTLLWLHCTNWYWLHIFCFITKKSREHVIPRVVLRNLTRDVRAVMKPGKHKFMCAHTDSWDVELMKESGANKTLICCIQRILKVSLNFFCFLVLEFMQLNDEISCNVCKNPTHFKLRVRVC